MSELWSPPMRKWVAVSDSDIWPLEPRAKIPETYRSQVVYPGRKRYNFVRKEKPKSKRKSDIRKLDSFGVPPEIETLVRQVDLSPLNLSQTKWIEDRKRLPPAVLKWAHDHGEWVWPSDIEYFPPNLREWLKHLRVRLLRQVRIRREEGGGSVVIAPTGTPANAYVAEDGTTFYVAEDGSTFYVQET